jgi:hypothetical protein
VVNRNLDAVEVEGDVQAVSGLLETLPYADARAAGVATAG